MIVKPIAMTFDERGRLWVDRIARLSEQRLQRPARATTRSRSSRTRTATARPTRSRSSPTRSTSPRSLTFANGGVIVAAMPNMLFLKDTNGDDKADVREVLSTGWGMRDTHGEASNLQYGPDNYIWGSVGYNGRGNVGGKQFSPGRVPLQAGRQQLRSHDAVDEQHVGPRLQRDLRRVRIDGQRRPELVHGDSRPVLRGRRKGCHGGGAQAGAVAAAALGYQSLAQFTTVHSTTPYIRQVDKQGVLHGRRGPHVLHGARVPEGVLEPHRVHQRADGAHRRPGRSSSRRAPAT